MAQPQIAPSLMCMDVSQVAHDVESMDRSFDLYHVDIMDGHFCPNMALTPQFANSLRKITNLPIDVHLMVEDPAMFVEMLELGPQDSISFPLVMCSDWLTCPLLCYLPPFFSYSDKV